jgi:2'-5' RNA ligase
MRLFVGISLPRYLRSALQEVQDAQRHGINWTPPNNLHITLKFIGEWEDDPGPVIRQLFEIQNKPFLLPVAGAGAFPPPPRKTPHVVWVGLGNGHPHLFGLQRKIDHGLSGLGVETDVRVYQPHITVGRCKSNAVESVRQWVKAHQDVEMPPFQVEFFTLYESLPSLKGRTYRPIETFQLGDV